jgi:hypothetical protein
LIGKTHHKYYLREEWELCVIKTDNKLIFTIVSGYL